MLGIISGTIIAFVVASSSYGGLANPSLGARPGESRGASATRPLEDPAVVLQVVSPSEGAGSTVTFELNITGVSCGLGTSSFPTIASVTISTGDGFQFSEPGVSGQSSCVGPPWFETISFGYVYASPGTYRASASVLCADDVRSGSNVVTVNVTNTPTSLTVQLQTWLYGVVATALLVVAFLLILRRVLSPPPSLPPSQV